MKEINYAYSIGSNCDSTFFIRHYKLSKFSGPFDWVYVDFNSALKNIEQKFERYTKDLFYYNPDVNYNNMSIEELKLHLISDSQKFRSSSGATSAIRLFNFATTYSAFQ